MREMKCSDRRIFFNEILPKRIAIINNFIVSEFFYFFNVNAPFYVLFAFNFSLLKKQRRWKELKCLFTLANEKKG
jgi:hypothetical protein